MRYRKLLSTFAGIAAMAMFAGTAYADGFYLEPRFGVEVSDIDAPDDSMQAKLAFGYDFEPLRVDLEYGWGNNTAFVTACPKSEDEDAPQTCYGAGADDELAAMVWYDFKTSTGFTPYLGGGAGTMVESWSDFEFGDAFWKAGGGVSYAFNPTFSLTGHYTYRQAFNDSDDNRSEVVLGTRISF